MAWHGTLDLNYRVNHSGGSPRCTVADRHDGPLRVLAALYPEGLGICQSVIVHPPGGVAGGDTLTMNIDVAAGAHAMITTPGATRFYRSAGERALQSVRAEVAAGARLEWLPLETLCYSGCIAQNHLTLDLAPGAECMGWDVTALGLPHADLPFERGSFVQHLELPGVWLERGRIDAADARLMNGPLGLAGQRCMATLFFVSGGDIPRARRDAALDAARALIEAHALRPTAGATAPHPRVLVVRVLAPVVEPAMQLLKALRGQWRDTLWGLSPHPPRIWSA